MFHGLAALTTNRQHAHPEEYRVAGTPQSKKKWVTPEKGAVALKRARMQVGLTPNFKKVSEQNAALGKAIGRVAEAVRALKRSLRGTFEGVIEA